MALEKIQYTDSLREGTDKLNAAIEHADDAKTISQNANNKADNAVSIAQNANSKADSVQVQLDTIVIQGDSSVEAAQARVSTDSSGQTKTYNTLKERLDTEHNKVLSQLEEEVNILNTVINNTNQRFVAHRGLSAQYPENTIPAFIAAAQVGFWGVECDANRTADGVWVVMHDDTVDRTTNGTGRVKYLTYDYISSLTIDGGANISRYPNLKVPTLEEYLIICRNFNITPIIELKMDLPNLSDNYTSLIELIKKYGFEDSCYIISFSLEQLASLRSISNIPLMYLVDVISNEVVDDALCINADIATSYLSITESSLVYAREKGIKILLWTINDVEIALNHLVRQADFISSDILNLRGGRNV